MPLITRTYIRTSLVYLAAGLAAGILTLTGVNIPTLSALYIHLLVVGWLTQLIAGVALWMFPRFSKEAPRGPEWMLWTVYGLLNAGLVMRIIAEPMSVAQHVPLWTIALIVSAVAQMLAGWLFVAAVWPRVRAR